MTLPVKQIQDELARIQKTLSLAHAKSQAKDIKELIEVLKRHNNEAVDQYVQKSKEILEEKKTKTSKAPPQLNISDIQKYIQAFKDCGTNKNKFETVFSEMKNDKNIRKAELFEIVTGYYGKMPKNTKVAELENRIHKKFIELGQYESKKTVIDKLSAW